MLLTWLAFAGVGLGAGVLGAVFGLGGGIFLVPAMYSVMDVPLGGLSGG